LDSAILHLEYIREYARAAQPISVLQQHFSQSRYFYKQAEPITEYFFQGLTKRINGPVLPDVKVEDGQVLPPHGYQVIEQLLFTPETAPSDELLNEINVLINDLRFVKKQIADISIQQYHFKELVQHQIIRIATTGITGLDAPLSKQSIPEAAASLTGLSEMCKQYLGSRNPAFYADCAHAALYATQHTDFDAFDRLFFITKILAPLSNTFDQFYAGEKTEKAVKGAKFVTGNLYELLRGEKLDADYFSPYKIAHTNPAKVALGKKLFFDKALSKNGDISCASCHRPELAFSDGLKTAANFPHGGNLPRNTPTLYYAGIQNSQFYDMRSTYLEDQIDDVMNNTDEFDLPGDQTKQRILGQPAYAAAFKKAFPDSDSLNSYLVRNAIAAYVRSLAPFRSPFDHYLRGDTNALSPEAAKGFNLFAGKAKCATCHFIPVFNGTIPPWYNKTESEIIGVPVSPVTRNAVIDPDPGRYAIHRLDELAFAFKTPTVRNAALTAPYMHNGAYQTLEEVIAFYHLGGGSGIGIDLPGQSLPFDNLQLSTPEKKALIAFIHALTDEVAK
jgi:cytochrome c peroxidase